MDCEKGHDYLKNVHTFRETFDSVIASLFTEAFMDTDFRLANQSLMPIGYGLQAIWQQSEDSRKVTTFSMRK